MSRIEKILVAVDGSENAQRAATFAGALSRDTGAGVDLLTVHHNDLIALQMSGGGLYPGAPVDASISVDEFRHAVEKDAQENVFTPAMQALGDITVAPQSHQLWGHPAEAICEYAETQGIDLIVVGSRGRTGFAKLVLGSVSAQVVTHASCSVTVVK